jgi:protein-L-isoaspartate(D-aspartate) O-methyltransferase
MTDFALTRDIMVQSQIIPEEVSNPRILEAFKVIPRERFVPRQLSRVAYMDCNYSFKKGRILLRPATLAKLINALNPQPSDKILYLACATGYGPAILGQLDSRVFALDSDESFTTEAEQIINDLQLPTVEVILGPLAEGWEQEAPFDKILIEGCVERLPKSLITQLKEEGEIVTIKSKGDQGMQAVKLIKKKGALTEIPLFDAFAPRLKAFRFATRFVF